MSEKKSDRTETPEQDPKTVWSTLPRWFQALILFFWEIIERIFTTIRSIAFLILDTILMILPSVALTSKRDDEGYIRKIRDQMVKIIQGLDIDKSQEKIILQNWLEQLIWTNNRANRERNANELIRWWQIILGVLIPVLNSGTGDPETKVIGDITITVLVSLIGIFVAILTSIAQFRRPEERWRHYRRVTENYQGEMWDFIALSGEIYVTESGQRITSHREGFVIFNQRMSKIRQDDLANFFGENNVSSKPMDIEELKKQLDAYESLQVRIRTRQPHVVASSDVAGTPPTVG